MNTHIHLVPRLRICGALFLLPHILCFTVCTVTILNTSLPHYIMHYYTGHISRNYTVYIFCQMLHFIIFSTISFCGVFIYVVYIDIFRTYWSVTSSGSHIHVYTCVYLFIKISGINPYPTAFPYGNGMVLHFYQQQESSTTKPVHKVINKGLKTYV